ncbi:MAG: hypothetical protein ACYTHM_09790 [Planctomycetota bacterium]|jgi:hypothetical protein
MMKATLPLSLTVLILCAASALGQSNRRNPEIGYLYPAGARQGTVVKVLVGGQNLRGLRGVRVTGEGVSGSLFRYNGRFTRLNGEERRAVRERLQARKAELGGAPPPEEQDELYRRKKRDGKGAKKPDAGKKGGGDKPGEKKEPDPGLRKITRHPLLSILDRLTLEELEFVERKFMRFNRRLQPNAQINETAVIEITVDPDAAPGNRELRILTPRGMTNPLCFQVGQLPEVRETAPGDARGRDTKPVELPVVLNGQITPGDVDRFCIRAEKGQKLVIRAQARQLVPFLADAVPGWFQAILTIRDGNDREIAYADDYRFDPDPVLYFEVPETGIYKIDIYDSIYRGRDDFVYRISVSEGPFIKSLFPLGGQSGEETMASLVGWNLPPAELQLDTRPGSSGIRFTTWDQEGVLSNPVAYAVDGLPEIVEAEPNDDPEKAQKVVLPAIVNGRIANPGDKTVYKMGHLHREMGVLTHHSDSYLRATLPKEGVYFIEVTDAQGRGNKGFGYRLRLGPPRGDFALRVTPSGLNLSPGRATVIHLHALRKDGFDGEIEVRLKDAPKGFELQGNVIPAGRDHIRMTIRAPNRGKSKLIRMQMEGYARIGEREVTREVVPADNEMQAFLWRHLVPAQELIVALVGRGGRGLVNRMGEGPVQIPLGGSARVLVKIPRLPNPEKIELKLNEAPKGITLTDVKILPDRAVFNLRADEKATQVGFGDNLIVDAFTEVTYQSRRDKKKKVTRRIWIGVFPAIPVRVVEKEAPESDE